jgi:hypothetical protein
MSFMTALSILVGALIGTALSWFVVWVLVALVNASGKD